MRTDPRRARSIAVAAATAVLVAVPAAAAQAATPDPTATYIVQVQDGSVGVVAGELASVGAHPDATFTHALDGFAVELTDSQVAALSDDQHVIDVVANTPASLSVEESTLTPAGDYSTATQSPAGSWGLDRIDQVDLPLDNRYTYDAAAGAGVRVYVMDTGVAPNALFGSRLAPGYTAVADGNGTVDCHGHGTHVAGIIASATYGVAKAATIVPVRVADCEGSSDSAKIIAGLNWISANHPQGVPGVVNISLSGLSNTAENAAVNTLVAQGFVVAVSAGNDAADACTRSPASAPSALTVGATDVADARTDYSNYGSCLDVFAPGDAIRSLYLSDPDSFVSGSGTSMASPHVAGVAALYLGAAPTHTAAQAAASIVSGAAPGKITDALGSPNLLLRSTIIPVPAVPTTVTPGTPGISSVPLTWQPGTGGGTPTDYTVSWRTAAGDAWTTLTVSTTSTTLTGLVPATTYEVTVAATNSAGSSAPSTPVQVTTVWAAVPSAPKALQVTGVTATTVDLAWAPPATYADLITGYRVQWSTAGSSWTTRETTPQARSLRLTGLDGGTTSEVRLMALAGVTPGAWASTIVTTARALTASERYVTAVYRDLFSRAPDAGGLTVWSRKLDGGTPRAAVANSITGSREYRAGLIQGVYRHYLGRSADPGGLASWLSAMGRGWTVQEIESGFIASNEYYGQSGGTPADWVNRLYADVLGRSAAPSEVSFWTRRLAAGAGRTQVAMGFLLSTEHLATVVDGYYVDLLGRHLDVSGRASWIRALQRGAREEQIIAGIVASPEYYGHAT